MEQKIKIAVIGGTGKSGHYLVKQLINQGYNFKLLLRHPEKFLIESPLIEIIKGDARNYEAVRALVEGCRAVISTLGQPKEESPQFSQATTHVIRAMHEYGVQRYILVTGLSIDLPFDQKSTATKTKSEWMKRHFPDVIADKQKEYTIMAGSDVDWTLVRIPFIEQTEASGEVKVSLEDCPGEKISATDLANFLIGQLSDNRYLKRSPFIANA